MVSCISVGATAVTSRSTTMATSSSVLPLSMAKSTSSAFFSSVPGTSTASISSTGCLSFHLIYCWCNILISSYLLYLSLTYTYQIFSLPLNYSILLCSADAASPPTVTSGSSLSSVPGASSAFSWSTAGALSCSSSVFSRFSLCSSPDNFSTSS
ncbi:uncharacterized protein [Anolis sagrei]|uniref:uncharacterized protein n=1 Tax=Anolis sagrei TaxID=38937 RepID=UPI003521D018